MDKENLSNDSLIDFVLAQTTHLFTKNDKSVRASGQMMEILMSPEEW